MATFTYEALNTGGQEVKAELEAPSKEEAVAKIRGLGYFPTKITEKGAKKKISAKKAASRSKKKAAGAGFGWVGVKILTQFTRQLSTLQDAGLPLLRSIQILEAQQKPGQLKAILAEALTR